MSKIEDRSINDWKQTGIMINKLLNELKSILQHEPSLMIITNAEFQKIFKITEKTALRWREKNLVGYSRINGNIYYTMKDVIDLYNEHYVKPRTMINNLIKKENEKTRFI